ncbi:hypothetical protein CPAV1605_785 [seawater metagenome]|uniref:Glycosyl transferase family 8 n=1 Tax=seawater metagenome TaxID=1561972 RepID=A0A5E8CMC5_9ZZZZ
MNKICVFTGGNDKYFGLINDLINSIRHINKIIKIGIIDGGLSQENTRILKEKNCHIIKYNKLDHIITDKKSKINILRLWLDVLAEENNINATTLIWLDADTWIQNNEIFHICHQICLKDKLGIKSQSSRYDTKTIQYKKILPFKTYSLFFLRNILYKNTKTIPLSSNEITKLEAVATLNSGVFCLHAKSKSWEIIRNRQKYIIDNGGNLFSSDQLSIGYAVYLDDIEYELLPDYCNYFFSYKIRWNEKINKFVEYYPPYNEISVLHYCGLTKFTKNWTLKKMHTLTDQYIEKDISFKNKEKNFMKIDNDVTESIIEIKNHKSLINFIFNPITYKYLFYFTLCLLFFYLPICFKSYIIY